jgi:uncharacterized membrane protein
MDNAIPLIILIILAVPVIIIVSLFSLAAKVKQLTERLDVTAARLDLVEAKISALTRQTAGETPVDSPRQEVGAAASMALEPQPEVEPVAELSPVVAPPFIVPPLTLPVPASEPIHEPVYATVAAGPSDEAGPQPEFVSPDLPSRTPETGPGFGINWEQFMGVKLFAWIGGFALFLGVAFFIKYSFEHNLIPPEVRVALGFIVGIGLLIGGVMMKRQELAVTSQTLCATGVVILYAVAFACHAVYHFPFFGQLPTFVLMVLITATAFTLAVQLEAIVVAILGLVGGFLTPMLLSTGQDNPLGLFTYIGLLDLGLVAVAFKRRWHFLILLAGLGTLLMQIAWAAEFFAPEKVYVAMAVFFSFDVLFLLALAAGERLDQSNDWLSATAAGLPFATFAFAGHLLSVSAIATRPGVWFSFVVGADLCLLALVMVRGSLQRLHLIAGTVVFALMAAWTGGYLTRELLPWALGLNVGIAALHTFFPVALARWRPGARQTWWGHVFPALALLLILIPIVKEHTVVWLVWPSVLLLDVMALGLALLTASVFSIVAVLLLTMLTAVVWLATSPAQLTDLSTVLTVITVFALFFFVMGTAVSRRIGARLAAPGDPALDVDRAFSKYLGGDFGAPDLVGQVPALSAVLPFLLLLMVINQLPLSNPSSVFGVALLLGGLLLGLGLISKVDALAPVSLACILALEYTWHGKNFATEAPWVPLVWYLGFYAIYTLFPFVFQRRLEDRILPWAVSALTGPLQFFLIYRLVSSAWPNSGMGLLPAAMAVPMLVGLWQVERSFASDSPMRLNLLAWFGASALFFITLIFPIQFERQWITVGWALEGLALIWLFHHVAHPGLRATSVVLLTVAFVRLALNPAVLEYHRESALRVVNWYLYAYGIVTVCLMTAARMLAPPRNLVWKQNIPPFLYTLGTVLAFLLVNIEIADYFAEGPTLTFQFSGNFARDMSYSMTWSLFALAMLIVGIWKRLPAPRYAAIGLLLVTLLKLFLHDLSQLGQLYRIGAFIVVATILIVASFLYQRFVAFDGKAQQAKA